METVSNNKGQEVMQPNAIHTPQAMLLGLL